MWTHNNIKDWGICVFIVCPFMCMECMGGIDRNCVKCPCDERRQICKATSGVLGAYVVHACIHSWHKSHRWKQDGINAPNPGWSVRPSMASLKCALNTRKTTYLVKQAGVHTQSVACHPCCWHFSTTRLLSCGKSSWAWGAMGKQVRVLT